jgi:hypothetical protein
MELMQNDSYDYEGPIMAAVAAVAAVVVFRLEVKSSAAEQTCTGTVSKPNYLTTKAADSRATKNQAYILHIEQQDPKVWASNSLFEILVFFRIYQCVVVVVVVSLERVCANDNSLEGGCWGRPTTSSRFCPACNGIK